MASFRADLIDGLLGETAVTDVVGNRIFPIILTFEDMLNTAANKWPRITVEQLERRQENNLNDFSCLYFSNMQISIFHSIHLKAARSRRNDVVIKERQRVRNSMDELFEVVETYLKGLRQTTVGEHFIRKSQIINSIDEEYQIDRNRIIVVNRMIYDVTYSK